MKLRRGIACAIAAAAAALLTACGATAVGTAAGPGERVVVANAAAAVETHPVPHDGDSADDAAIWVDRAAPSRSVVVATDKKGGIAVYDLHGRPLEYRPDGKMNNVDLRTGFLLAGRTVPIVVATVREARALAVYRLDTSTRRLVPVGAGRIRIGISAYGLCLYRSPEGRFSAFVNSEHGQVEEWRLLARGGLVEGRRVRRFDVGSRTEGCVVDDASRRLYIAEENQGIWRYDLAGPSRRRLVDATGGGGHLTADVEGLALVRREGGTGYLIASSQGDDTFAVYRREGRNRYLGSFRIHDGAGADEVTGTDGIDATSSPLGPAFPHGLLVAQDGDNDGGNQNFKLVPLEAVIRGGQP